ncbi:MAG: glycosyltransferase family 9 protein [Woeseia sp.]
MKVNSMRLLDRWMGSPISAVLTVVRKLVDVIRIEPVGPPQRIVFVKLVEQGATVIAEPALRRAVEMVGRDNVFVTVFEQNRFILDILNLIPPENVITIRSTGFAVVCIDTIRAIWRMRREKIDAAVDFEFFSRYSGTLIYLSGAKRRVGLHSFAGEAGYRGDLMTHRVGYNLTFHASQTYRALVEALTLPAEQLPAMNFQLPKDQAPPAYHPDIGQTRDVELLLQQVLGCESIPPLILLNANSGDLLPLRRWPLERYVDLAHRLLRHYPEVMIAFTGSLDEREEAERLVALVDSDRCVSIGGRTTLRQLLIVYGLADILVTNDSGPAHYAAMTPIDVVTLFGPETPAIFGSRSPRSHVIWAGLPCSPCVNAFNQRVTTCTNNLCMQSISVDEVFDTVCRVFDQRHNLKRRKPVGGNPVGEPG